MAKRQLSPTEIERIKHKQDEIRARHSAALVTLMSQRDDLRGVYAFADYVDDAVRWSA
jgi:hypothetical protein